MHIQRFLIAGGNSTALVAECPAPERPEVLSSLMGQVEQVGFIDQGGSLPHIQMMGGEFCINATLAFASVLGQTGTLAASGAEHPVSFCNSGSGGQEAAIRLPLKWRKEGNIVLLEGIGFVLLEQNGHATVEKDEIKALCMRYSLPAFGAILFNDDAITPYVYVAGVESFVRETACGSGSVALHLFNGTSRVKQPTGQFITVTKHVDFHISARVTTMNDRLLAGQP